MITVEKVTEKSKNSAKVSNAVNEELLRTGQVKAKKQSYLPWILLAAAAIVGGFLLWKKGKQDNGALSG